jgi:Uncharacterized protein conserved in bacteria
MKTFSFARARAILGAAALCLPAGLQAQNTLSPNSPRDKPVVSEDECQLRAWTKAIQPFVDSARMTYPAAKARYLSGAVPRNTFFVTMRLTDEQKKIEQIFVTVDSIRTTRIYGRIASQIEIVHGYRYGQPIDLAESDLMDWMFAKPDGSEEGNVVGKFMDTYKPPSVCSFT